MELDFRKVRLISPKILIEFFYLIGSPYRERFSEIILDLQEKGIVSSMLLI
jgi:hypothetical protein